MMGNTVQNEEAMRKVVIIGGGEAGVAAAEALRVEGFAGDVVILSAEEHLPYDRPQLSKETLLKPERACKLIRDAGWYEANRVDLRLGTRVASIDPVARTVTSADGASIGYDRLLLATGAIVRRLDDVDPDVVLYLREISDARALRDRLGAARSVVVIGGGVIGLEIASSARALGKEVTVIEAGPRLMARALAPDVSEELLALHRRNGVDVRVGARPLSVARVDDGIGVELSDGSTVRADVAIGGIGVVPCTALGEAAGCRVENGIVVDGAGRTSVEGVFAAGDVASLMHSHYGRPMRIEAWQHAGRHGAHVGRAMLGRDDGYGEIPWFWTDQHGTNVQVAGLASECDATVWREGRTGRTALHFAGDRLVAATTIDNGRDMRPAIRLLAAGWRGSPAELADPSRPLADAVKAQANPNPTTRAA